MAFYKNVFGGHIFYCHFPDYKNLNTFLMKKLFLFLLVGAFSCTNTNTISDELAGWEKQAERITITRDSYGVPHIYGDTDADAVFGMIFAQCEDDFNRVEMNYINAMGRLAEVEGEDEIYRDLRMKLFIDPEEMKQDYESSPIWLKDLMNAFADGINYYLYTHPETQPKLLTRFEPWMALTFSEGSIGGDIERVNLSRLKNFYGEDKTDLVIAEPFIRDDEPRGSNGISIAPQKTKNGNALFLINPHTSFFFRSEVHMISQEGLNAYGAVTWGQFFIYQGFNERVGWMHTSSRADAIDEYLETIFEKDDTYYYLVGEDERELESKVLSIPYKTDAGNEVMDFTVYYSHHGPIIREQDGKWVSIALMQRPVDALTQSYTRTKANNYQEFYETMEIRTNSSNNTVYADADGTIAYFHGNYIPIRDTRFDWSKPLDGSNPDTDYEGLHSLEEMIVIKNPENGWIQNCNSSPFTAAGEFSPKQEDYASYIAPDQENFRGIHAVRVLKDKTDFTIESLIEAAYDSQLPGFEKLVPSIVGAYEAEGATYPELNDPIESLKGWDIRFSAESVPTSVATYYGNEMLRQAREMERGPGSIYDFIVDGFTTEQKLDGFKVAINKMTEDFGSWEIPWGEINRYQRINGDIRQPFNDDEPSLPVGFHSGRWGLVVIIRSQDIPKYQKNVWNQW